MLSNLAISLAIDAFGPISDNASGIVEMCDLGGNILQITDALDSARNTTSAIGKRFAIGSAALVSQSLYRAIISRVIDYQQTIQILDEFVFTSLLFGAILPYWFSGITLKTVRIPTMDMVREVRRQLENSDIKKESNRQIITSALGSPVIIHYIK
jgi:inorganic pyrophosphatase